MRPGVGEFAVWAFLGSCVLFVVYILYIVATRETFDLAKDHWECTRSSQQLTMIGKIITTSPVCEQYTRIGL
jgi:hypothetical protein